MTENYYSQASMKQKLELNITGMDCADCALTLEKSLVKLDGVEDCQVNFSLAKMEILGDADEEKVRKQIKRLGYGVTDVGNRPQILKGWPLLWDLLKRPRNTLTLLGMISIGFAFLSSGSPSLQLALFSLGGVFGLYFPARSGWAALRSGQGLDMNVLMTIAAIGAFIIGEYGEAATVIVLFSLGEALEGLTMERARDSIRGLMLLAPAEATLLTGCMDCKGHLGKKLPHSDESYEGGICPWCGKDEQTVPVESLKIGDHILVQPGERIPMDGVVQSGSSAVDQAPITGESIPIEKNTHSEVFAGTINGDGALEILITKIAKDNTLARLIHLVEEAQAQKTPSQRFVDRFARIYTPAVVMLAVLVAAIPPLFFGQPFTNTPDIQGWLYRSLTMLVIACPCALVIATPVSVVSGIASLAKRGVLVKGGAHLEMLGKIDLIAFDKTGTLTHGRPELTDLLCADECCEDTELEKCHHCDEMLTLASAVERQSTHPLARSLVQAAHQRSLPALEAYQVEALPGRGISGYVGEKKILIGNHPSFHSEHPDFAFIDRKKSTPDFCQRIDRAEAAGQSTMVVAADQELMGYLAVSDPPRSHSREVLAALKEAGIQKTAMLTGDNASVAAGIGNSLGVDEIHAELLPEDKLTVLKGLQKEYEAVAMIGDGVNDAPALAAAELGIAMGGAGTAQALETADIALMADDLAQLPVAIRIGRKAANIIRFNIAFAFVLKALFLLLATFGSVTLWMAVIADVGTSLLVTLNGMRLLLKNSVAKASS
ncbi:MAG: cation-translocating P-type ATPase [Chloroflexi bacterium]|nr:cation-translocating P-type ATPase [Chloroflexota bacterium]